MAAKTDRLGETRMMNCGMEATIIRYGTCADIDVRFEDGTVAVHKTYNAFKKGEIANPNMKVSAEDRLGETRMMNCGMEAAIIRYLTAFMRTPSIIFDLGGGNAVKLSFFVF